MRKGTGPRRAVCLENLENRVLFSRISVADFGAVPGDGRDDHAAITRAINASQAGDTIVFEAGRYDLGQQLRLQADRTYRGQGRLHTTLKFHVGHGGWGMKPVADASNITVENFLFDGGGIALSEGRLFKDITIRNNEFVNTPRATFNNNGPAIFSGVRSERLTITGNYIHDTDKYGLILYAVDRLTLTNNTFKNLMQAGHIMDLGKDNTVSFNHLSGMVRMGFELQRHGERTAENTTVEGNVITDWRYPYRDSFGLSIVPDGSVNTRVINNYIQGVPRGWDGEWNPVASKEGQSKRMGYGIEYGARSGEVSGNVIGGAFVNHIIISGGGGKHDGMIEVSNNKLYGKPVWNDWITKESYGADGFGWRERNNMKDESLQRMPPPPNARPVERPEAPVEPEQPQPNPTQPAKKPKAPAPPPSPWQAQGFVWLSDQPWLRADNGFGPVETDQSNGGRNIRDGATMTLGDRAYQKGLGVAMNSRIIYDLEGKYLKFFSHIGIDGSVGDVGSMTFQVWADGRKIYDSGMMTGKMAGRALELDIAGVKQLNLVTTDGGDGGRNDLGNWAGAKLVPAPTT